MNIQPDETDSKENILIRNRIEVLIDNAVEDGATYDRDVLQQICDLFPSASTIKEKFANECTKLDKLGKTVIKGTPMNIIDWIIKNTRPEGIK